LYKGELSISTPSVVLSLGPSSSFSFPPPFPFVPFLGTSWNSHAGWVVEAALLARTKDEEEPTRNSIAREADLTSSSLSLSFFPRATRNLPLHPQSLRQLRYHHHLPRSFLDFPSLWSDGTQPFRTSNGDRLGSYHLDLPPSAYPHQPVRSSLSLSLSLPVCHS